MKVMIQNSVFHPNVIGGAEFSTYLLARELWARGFEVDALASTGHCSGPMDLVQRPLEGTTGVVYESAAAGFCDFLGPDGPPPQAGILRRGLHHFASVLSPRWLRLAHKALDRSRPDVLHTNTIVGLTPAIWRAAAEVEIPVVHTLRDYHLLCPRTTLLRSNNRDCVSPPLPCRMLREMKRRVSPDIAVVTAPSQFVLDRHLDAGWFAKADAEVVVNACDSSSPPPDRSAPALIRGLYLGQMDQHKGVPQLLDALDRLPGTEVGFDFAGLGPLVERVEAFCRKDPIRFRYHGMVRGEQKKALLDGAAFLVIPSVWNEPFGRTILEAFAQGLPVIGSRRGGIPEVIDDGVNGQVVEPEASELARAMELYANNATLCRRHGENALHVMKKYSLETQVESFVEIYERICRPT